MHELLAGAALLPVLIAAVAAQAEAAGCRRLPRIYGGGVDLLDRPPREEGVQQL